MSSRPDCPAGHLAEGYGRLRPACCNPLAALSLEAFARVGAWTPPLPPQDPVPSPATPPAGPPALAPLP